MLWDAVKLALVVVLLPRAGVRGSMSPYYRAAGKCLYRPEGAPSYEIPCSDWELEAESWEREQLGE